MVLNNVSKLEGHVLEPVVDLEGIDLSVSFYLSTGHDVQQSL